MKLPDRWLNYKAMGSVISGTRFLACKVPLREVFLRSLPKDERFGPEELMKAVPNIGLLIDLTNTNRYYSSNDITNKNIQYEKIYCMGHVVPSKSVFNQFSNIIDKYLAENKDSDSVIVVHCTHGVNRTGYLICRYMIEKMKIPPEEALTNFKEARGHIIERETYVNDLKNKCKGGPDDVIGWQSGRKRYERDDWREKGKSDRISHHKRSNTIAEPEEDEPTCSFRERYPVLAQGFRQQEGSWRRKREQNFCSVGPMGYNPPRNSSRNFQPPHHNSRPYLRPNFTQPCQSTVTPSIIFQKTYSPRTPSQGSSMLNPNMPDMPRVPKTQLSRSQNHHRNMQPRRSNNHWTSDNTFFPRWGFK